MNNKKSAQKYLRKVVKSCRNGVLHPQIENELLSELVNLLNAAQQSVQRIGGMSIADEVVCQMAENLIKFVDGDPANR